MNPKEFEWVGSWLFKKYLILDKNNPESAEHPYLSAFENAPFRNLDIWICSVKSGCFPDIRIFTSRKPVLRTTYSF